MSQPARILIVDDEPNVRLVFRTALEPAGCTVSEAGDGESALAALRHGSFDLMILDLLMPHVSGMEVLRRLRETGHDLPVIVVTAHGSVPHAVEAMRLGAIDFLSKPLSPEALRQAVSEVIERHAAGHASANAAPEVITAGSQFAANLTRAKRAINHRWFDEAEVFLRQALALNGGSAEAHNLMGVLHELRNEFDAAYREYKAALKADHGYEPAKHNMSRYYERFTFGRSEIPVDLGNG